MTFSQLRRMESLAAQAKADAAARKRGRLVAFGALRRGQAKRQERLRKGAGRVVAGA